MKVTKKLSKDKEKSRTHNDKANIKTKELEASAKHNKKTGWWSE